MNHKLRVVFISIFALMIAASCGKRKNNVIVDPNAKQHNDDVSNLKSESDNVNSDINQVLNGVSGFGKNGGIEAVSICGASIDSSQQYAATPTLYVNFDGTTICTNPTRIRSGQIKVELISGAKWTDAGAVLRVTHIDYKVKFPTLNNHFVTFNGTKFLTNVNGINWVSIYLGSSTAKIRERSYNMQVTFENGRTSSWNVARLSEWGIQNLNQVYAIVNADTTIGGKRIDSWGLTRFGTNFSTEMIQAWKSGTACGWWKPTQGKYTSTTDDFRITTTFGVDQNGNQMSSGCAYGVKLDWLVTANGKTGDAVFQYF
jgi:hypothetical protein